MLKRRNDMNSETSNSNNIKKIAIGTVTSVAVCSLLFIIIVQSVKASVINKTKIIPTTYSSTAVNVKKITIPKDNVKTEYNIRITDRSYKPTAKDISAKAAAALGIQDIRRLFGTGANLKGKIIDMAYWAVNPNTPHAQWAGDITIGKNLSYFFVVNSVTGECVNTGRNRYLNVDRSIDMDKALMGTMQDYKNLAIKIAKKYNLVSGKIVSAEYRGQGAVSNSTGRNSTMDILVKSESGQQTLITFSRHNQEFLGVQYDQWIKDSKSIKPLSPEEIKKLLAKSSKSSKSPHSKK